MYIGIDAHKLSESICVTDDAGTIVEEYKMENTQENWNGFMNRYIHMNPPIKFMAMSTSWYFILL